MKFEPIVSMYGITDGRSVYIPSPAKEVRRYLENKGLAFKQKRSLLQGTVSIELVGYSISFYLESRTDFMSYCHQSPWPTEKGTPEDNNRVFKMIRADMGASSAAYKERQAGKSGEPLYLRMLWIPTIPFFWGWIVLTESVPNSWRAWKSKLRRARRRRGD